MRKITADFFSIVPKKLYRVSEDPNSPILVSTNEFIKVDQQTGICLHSSTKNLETQNLENQYSANRDRHQDLEKIKIHSEKILETTLIQADDIRNCHVLIIYSREQKCYWVAHCPPSYSNHCEFLSNEVIGIPINTSLDITMVDGDGFEDEEKEIELKIRKQFKVNSFSHISRQELGKNKIEPIYDVKLNRQENKIIISHDKYSQNYSIDGKKNWFKAGSIVSFFNSLSKTDKNITDSSRNDNNPGT